MFNNLGKDFLELVQEFHQAVFIGATWLIGTVADWIVNIGLIDDQLVAFFIVMTAFVCIFVILVFPTRIVKGGGKGGSSGGDVGEPITILIITLLIIKTIWGFFRKIKEDRLFLIKTIFVISTLITLAFIGYGKM
jgi:hypothetical protein